MLRHYSIYLRVRSTIPFDTRTAAGHSIAPKFITKYTRMADADVSTALLEKRKAMRVFLSKHGMETVAKEFHDAGYIETGDVMDMDAEDVDEHVAEQIHV